MRGRRFFLWLSAFFISASTPWMSGEAMAQRGNGGPPTALPDPGDTIGKAALSGAQVVPERQTKATAEVEIHFDAGFTSASVTLAYHELESPITGVSLRYAQAGEAGPEIVALQLSAGPGGGGANPGGLLEGVLRGTITNADIKQIAGQCSDCGGGGAPVNNLVSLAAAMEAKQVYIDLRTSAGDAIRGQMAVAAEVHTVSCDTITKTGGEIHFSGCSTITK